MTGPSALLSARSVSFGYHSSSPLFEDWSADFRRGEMVAIVGPSGRGKSTLLYMLGLMLKPQSGAIELEGVSVAALSDRERAHLRATRFGFVFQDAALDQTRSILDNVLESTLYRGADKSASIDRAKELLERFGVALRSEARPGQVSGGQAQRIALCRALLGEPDVVLADEPTGNLDSDSTDLVVSSLREYAANGATVVVVTHDSAVAARCDRTVTA